MMDIITQYFPKLDPEKKQQFAAMQALYEDWNEKINVISRKDIEHLYLHHVLHSLAIAKVLSFMPGTKVLDVGTGGGFPGIPLAILFPDVHFTLSDTIGKKIKVVAEVAKALNLKNVSPVNERAENIKKEFDFVTGRAVTDLKDVARWVKNKIKQRNINSLPNGLLYLKGGDLQADKTHFKDRMEIFPISSIFNEEWFNEKFVVYVEMGR